MDRKSQAFQALQVCGSCSASSGTEKIFSTLQLLGREHRVLHIEDVGDVCMDGQQIAHTARGAA
jgi:hypothetical protein